MPRLPVSLAAAGLLGLGCAPITLAPPAPPPSTFVGSLGPDTITIEQYTRRAAEIRGRALTRVPTTLVRNFTYQFFDDGTISRLEVISRRADSLEAPPVGRNVITFANDTAYVETGIGDDARVQWIPAQRPHVAWAAFPSFSVLEGAVQRAPESVGDSTMLSMYFGPALGGTLPLVIHRIAPDSVTLWSRHTGLIRAQVDEEGRVLGFDASRSTLGYAVIRDSEAPFDSLVVPFDSLVVAFAARDAGGGLGPLSPRDTARATVHGANLTVEYSRPSRRGREIFGGVVPWGQVWRTGANAATHLTIDRDVVIGALTVPRGTYTLWTVPDEEGWQLIINRQTGQWGTMYDPELDFGRTRMEVRRLDQPVEQFTIRIEPREVGGMLVLAWDTYEASVPFSPR